MKKILLILVYIGLICPSCNAKPRENKSKFNTTKSVRKILPKKQLTKDLKKQASDTGRASLSIIASFKVGVSPYFKTTDKDNFDFPAFFGENAESLILVNDIDYKLITINKLTGEVSSNDKVNQLLSEYDQKFKGFVTLVPYKGNYFIGFLRGIIFVSPEGHLISQIVLKQNLSQFTVLKDTSLIIFSGDQMLYAKKNSLEPKVYDLNFQLVPEDLILTENTVYESGYGSVTSVSYKNIMLGRKREYHNVKSYLPMKYTHLNAISPDYLIWADTEKGNMLYFLDRETFGKSQSLNIKVDKKIFSNNDIPLESVNGGVEIIASTNNLLYAVTMRNKEIMIYKLDINLQ